MLGSVHSWLLTNPLATEGIIGVTVGIFLLLLTPKVSPLVDTFWRFWAIPPQRLNVWVLKARLSSAESRLFKVQRMREDIRYLVFYCFWSLHGVVIVLVLLCLVVFLELVTDKSVIVHHAGTMPLSSSQMFAIELLVLIVIYVVMLLALNTAKAVKDAVLGAADMVETLEAGVEKLKARLVQKTTS
jgi:hypothetical protein